MIRHNSKEAVVIVECDSGQLCPAAAGAPGSFTGPAWGSQTPLALHVATSATLREIFRRGQLNAA